MNEKQIKAFVSFLSDNNVSLNDMYQALSGPKPGDIYFTDNSYFAYPLPGRTAKGVFVTSNCYVTNSRSSDELGYTKAKIFCFFNNRIYAISCQIFCFVIYKDNRNVFFFHKLSA